jgi:hypothetical protein
VMSFFVTCQLYANGAHKFHTKMPRPPKTRKEQLIEIT